MANRSRAIGTEWETRIVGHSRSTGVDVERLSLNGTEDEGDLRFMFGDVVIGQAKAEKDLNLYHLKAAMEQAQQFARHRNMVYVPDAVLILKRRNHPVGKSYVVQELDQWLKREMGR